MVDVLELAIAKLVLKPGDVLVVKINHTLSHDVLGRARDQVQNNIPKGVQVLLIDNSIDLSVLTQADIEARTH